MEDIKQYIPRLMKDLNLTREQAAGLLGNLAYESAGLQAGIEEGDSKYTKKQIKRGLGKGIGWAQWTGPRRKDFEKFVKDNDSTVTDPEMNYKFLVHELKGKESAALDALRNAKTAEDAGMVILNKYERPHKDSRTGKKLNDRMKWVDKLYNLTEPTPSPTPLPIKEPASSDNMDPEIKDVPLMLQDKPSESDLQELRIRNNFTEDRDVIKDTLDSNASRREQISKLFKDAEDQRQERQDLSGSVVLTPVEQMSADYDPLNPEFIEQMPVGGIIKPIGKAVKPVFSRLKQMITGKREPAQFNIYDKADDIDPIRKQLLQENDYNKMNEYLRNKEVIPEAQLISESPTERILRERAAFADKMADQKLELQALKDSAANTISEDTQILDQEKAIELLNKLRGK